MLWRAVATAGVCFVATSGAGASAGSTRATQTIRFASWVERVPGSYGYQPLLLRIRSVSINRAGWRVRADIINRSRQEIRIRPVRSNSHLFWRSNDFGVVEPGPPCDPYPNGPCQPTERLASLFRPRIHRTLRPGQAWRGTFGGHGLLQRRVPIYLTFGVFVPKRGNAFSWLTQRSFRIP